jgi:lysozyme family protein
MSIRHGYGEAWPRIAKQWDTARILAARQNELTRIANKLFAHKARYVAVEEKTGVPWYLIAAIHSRESDADFNTYLGNGEPLSRRTRLVPRGRGPFKTWEEGALDALKYDGLTSVKDWVIEKQLYAAEIFNGLGYRYKALPSPYVWGATNIQRAGKYVADGRWSSVAWDKQPGVAAIIKALMEIDPTIDPARET